MNPLQMALQIRKELQVVTWPSGSVVFGSRAVFVFAGTPPSEEQIPPSFPFALVSIDAGTPDADHPDLIEQQYSIVTAAEVAGDPLGEFAVTGGAAATLTKSAGRGVAEIAERVRSAVEDLTGADGARILLTSTAIGTPTAFGRGRHIVLDELTLTALCTSRLFYAAPQQIKENLGTWTWVGAHCSNRFDFVQYRLGFRVGVIPPETPADATIIYTGTATTTAHNPSSGRAYAIFADYNLRGQSTPDGSSSGSRIGAFVLT